MKIMYIYKPIRQGKTAEDEYGRLHFTQKPISELVKTTSDISSGRKYAKRNKYMYVIIEEAESE